MGDMGATIGVLGQGLQGLGGLILRHDPRHYDYGGDFTRNATRQP